MLVKLHDEFSLEALHIDSVQKWKGKLTEFQTKQAAVIYIGMEESAMTEDSNTILITVGMFHSEIIYVVPDPSYWNNESVQLLRESINNAKRMNR